jgi:hypothetical protein
MGTGRGQWKPLIIAAAASLNDFALDIGVNVEEVGDDLHSDDSGIWTDGNA